MAGAIITFLISVDVTLLGAGELPIEVLIRDDVGVPVDFMI